MKRILLVSPFPPYIGGVSVSVQRLYDHLGALGYEVVRFNTQMSNTGMNSKPLKFLKYLGLPLYIIYKGNFDIIHFHVSDILPKFYVSLWRSLFPGKTKFIITIHGQVRHTLSSRLGKYALGKFDRLILVKRNDIRHLPADLRSKAVEIPAFIPPVINDGKTFFFPQGLDEFLRKDSFKMLLNGFIILNDRFHDLYGFRDAVELLGKLRDLGKNVVLILVVLGTGYTGEAKAYTSDLKSFIRDRKLEDNVFWIEHVNMELWPLLKQVHVLLRPTKSDGDALSIRESLYLKVPVITSNAVPRPQGTIVYKLRSWEDLLKKTLMLMENYDNYVSCISNTKVNFANRIVEQYEHC
jgi:glycosyltransferase involved in cell wall biosynthesis